MTEPVKESCDRMAVVGRVTQLFEDSFGEKLDGVWSAPGRVNLIGEHTDYNGGLALPIALPNRTYVAAKKRTDRLVRLVSAQEGTWQEIHLDNVGRAGTPKGVNGWPAYVVGVAWAMEQTGAPVTGFDMAVDSCVPVKLGLSSSAALTASVAVALNDLSEVAASPEEMANWCVRAENEVVGAPTGGMDQAASLRSTAGHATLFDSQNSSVEQIGFDLQTADLSLVVIDTRTPHTDVDGQYAARRNTCRQAAETLGVEHLADIGDVEPALMLLEDPVARRRVRHVVTETVRTRQLAGLLRAAGGLTPVMEEVGLLFTQSHESLRDDYEVSCPELDVAVNAARQAGALGARMTGEGFGGAAIALVERGNVEAVLTRVTNSFANAGFVEPQFQIVEASEPAGRDW